MLQSFTNILKDIHIIIYPRICFGCNRYLLFNELLICTFCRYKLPKTNQHLQINNAVEQIFFGKIKIQKASSFLFYTKKGIVKQLIYHLKYKNQQKIGKVLGHWYGSILREQNAYNEVDILVMVPLHKKKLLKRGYNQVKYFAEALSQELGKPLIENILTKIIPSSSQTLKSKMRRSIDAKGVFEVNTPEKLENKHLLLVDDIVTTGATIEACVNAFPKDKNIQFSLISIALSV